MIDKEPEKIVKFNIGGMWEEKEWEIHYGCWIYEGDDYKCPHCTEREIVRTNRSDGSFFETVYVKCSRVVVAVNEGGYNSTGVCLDCILEAIKETK